MDQAVDELEQFCTRYGITGWVTDELGSHLPLRTYLGEILERVYREGNGDHWNDMEYAESQGYEEGYTAGYKAAIEDERDKEEE